MRYSSFHKPTQPPGKTTLNKLFHFLLLLQHLASTIFLRWSIGVRQPSLPLTLACMFLEQHTLFLNPSFHFLHIQIRFPCYLPHVAGDGTLCNQSSHFQSLFLWHPCLQRFAKAGLLSSCCYI